MKALCRSFAWQLRYLLVNLGYGLDGAFTRLGRFRFISKTLSGQRSGLAGNRFAGLLS